MLKQLFSFSYAFSPSADVIIRELYAHTRYETNPPSFAHSIT